MAAAQGGQDFQDRLKELCPLVDNLRLMLEAARHAFNRHSLPQLEKMAELHKNFTLDIDPFFEEVEAGLKDSSAAGQTQFLKLQDILSHLELMADKIAGLADHLRYKANHGIILSEEDLFLVNTMFSQLTGFMQALVDIFLVNDFSLKAYVLKASQKLTEECFPPGNGPRNRDDGHPWPARGLVRVPGYTFGQPGKRRAFGVYY